MSMLRGALGRRRPLPPVRRGSERTPLLAPVLLVAAVVVAAIGAGGIQHLSSLEQVAGGPVALDGDAGSGAEHAADVIVALAHDALPSDRQPRATGDRATGGADPPPTRGATASSVAGGRGIRLSDTAGVSPPAGRGDRAASGREPVGDLDDAVTEPLRDHTEPVDRVVDELLDELEGLPEETLLPDRRSVRIGR